MTPTRRTAATAGRLLAHGLGLGLLAGGVVLGAQGAAQALTYVFVGSDNNPATGLVLNFRSPGCTEGNIFADPYCYQGQARVTGSFNWDGSNLTFNGPVTFTPITGGADTEVGAFYWTAGDPDIVNPGREEQDSVSV